MQSLLKYLVVVLFIGLPHICQANAAVQFSVHHHNWNSGVLPTQSAPAYGLGVGYFGDRLYTSLAFAYADHRRPSSNSFIPGEHTLPYSEYDLATGYHFLTNVSAYLGLRYQRIHFDNVEDNALSFRETAWGLGVGIRLNQNIAQKWSLFERLGMSNLWYDNQHNQHGNSSYSGFGLNAGIGLLYRFSGQSSISADVAYKIEYPEHDIADMAKQRSYIKSGINLIFVM
ncbi:MAG: porin family protein [Gammaproteobacteria bacterium]|nr:porin family protein [Gammaproteobacteria bacterium]